MPLVNFICPDSIEIPIKDCLSEGGCRMGERCASRTYLKMASSERPPSKKFSTTQLIRGTMESLLILTKDYSVSPDSRAFMIHGTKGHSKLESIDDEYSFLEEKLENETTTGIADAIEVECGKTIMMDHKTSGSYKVSKALGFHVVDEGTGEFYKSGKKKGEEKTRKILKRSQDKEDRRDWVLQLNNYRLMSGVKPDELRIQCTVRDGNTFIARSRGVFRNVYYFKIEILPDEEVENYFKTKSDALKNALKTGNCEICSGEENWDGLKCQKYCAVARFCRYGKYLAKEKEDLDMPIKGISEVRRLPRLGKIRLGIKKVAQSGKEYPAEVDYFVFEPSTPSELENEKLKQEFIKLYGEKPKSIDIMFPVADSEMYFQQYRKRYGKSTSLKCKGDGEFAYCASEEFAKGLEIVGESDLGNPKVVCKGNDCIYTISRECSPVGTLQVLLPDMPGAGVWQISTGSWNSIVNVNSCIDYIKAVAGRAHMIPLKLERREQEVTHDGKKSKHYILHINMDFKLAEIQRQAMIDPTRILMELPEPEEEKEDILFEENVVINTEKSERLKDEKSPEPKPKKRERETLPENIKASLQAVVRVRDTDWIYTELDKFMTGVVKIDILGTKEQEEFIEHLKNAIEREDTYAK